jgi:hypothetical protein
LTVLCQYVTAADDIRSDLRGASLNWRQPEPEANALTRVIDQAASGRSEVLCTWSTSTMAPLMLK